MSKSASNRGLYDPADGFLASVGKYGGPVILIGLALFALLWALEPGAPKTVTVKSKMIACATPGALSDYAAAAASKSVSGVFFAGMAGRCRIIDPGEKVTHISTGGWFWLYAKIRHDGSILYVDSTML